MSAGVSAEQEAVRAMAVAEAHERAAAEARDSAARYSIAAVTEKQTARTLSPLAGVGYYLLADRRWPEASERRSTWSWSAGGVFIVDTKAWKDVSFADGRLFRGQEDVTDELDGLASLADLTQAYLAEIGLAPGEVHSLAVLAGRQGINFLVGAVQMIGEKDALRAIASRGNRLTPGQVDAVLARALTLFPEVNAPAPINVTVPEPVTAPPSSEVEQDALLSPDEVNDALRPAFWLSRSRSGCRSCIRNRRSWCADRSPDRPGCAARPEPARRWWDSTEPLTSPGRDPARCW